MMVAILTLTVGTTFRASSRSRAICTVVSFDAAKDTVTHVDDKGKQVTSKGAKFWNVWVD